MPPLHASCRRPHDRRRALCGIWRIHQWQQGASAKHAACACSRSGCDSGCNDLRGQLRFHKKTGASAGAAVIEQQDLEDTPGGQASYGQVLQHCRQLHYLQYLAEGAPCHVSCRFSLVPCARHSPHPVMSHEARWPIALRCMRCTNVSRPLPVYITIYHVLIVPLRLRPLGCVASVSSMDICPPYGPDRRVIVRRNNTDMMSVSPTCHKHM